MMKRLCVMAVLCAFAVVPATSMALPAVTNDPGCALVTSIDAGGEAFLGALGGFDTGLDIPTWPESDMESVLGLMDGDLVLDKWQTTLLGQALCAGDVALNAQFDANRQAYLGLVGNLVALIDWAGVTNTDAMAEAGAALLYFGLTTDATGGLGQTFLVGTPPDFLDAAVNPALIGIDPTGTLTGYATLILEVGGGLSLLGPEMASFASEYALLGPILGSDIVADWFTAMGGLNSEMQGTVYGLLDQLLGALDEPITEIGGITIAQALATLSGFGTQAAAVVDGYSAPALGVQLLGVVALLDEGGALLAAIVPPAFQVYGAPPKTADEPFSAAGDYSGDEVTNGVVAAAVVDSGGDEDEFVEWASGYDIDWSGNPNLPATGLLGLALLAGVIGVGGAFSIRKK